MRNRNVTPAYQMYAQPYQRKLQNQLIAGIGLLILLSLPLMLYGGFQASSNRHPTPFIGVWVRTDNVDTYEFRADGTGWHVGGFDRQPIQFTWKQSGSAIVITRPDQFEAGVTTTRVHGAGMTSDYGTLILDGFEFTHPKR